MKGDLLSEFSRKCASKGKLFEALVELTHRCNVKCVHCYINQERAPHERTTEEWEAAIDKLVEQGLCVITFTGGEPLLYPGLLRLVSYAFKKGAQVRVFSNLNLLASEQAMRQMKDAGLCYLETSIYGAGAETHDLVTGVRGSFEKTIRAIKLAREADIPVTAKTSWLGLNAREFKEIVELVKGLDIYFRGSPGVMPRIDGTSDNQKCRMSIEEMIEFYRTDMSNSEDACFFPDWSGGERRPCGIAAYSMTISPDGTMFPCSHMREPLGNVFSDSIKEVWTGSPMLDRLRSITTSDFAQCRDCELKSYCFVCMGDGWAEWGDPLKPSTETCMMARARRAAFESLDVER